VEQGWLRQHYVDRLSISTTHEVIELDSCLEEVGFDNGEKGVPMDVLFFLEGIDCILSKWNKVLEKSSNSHSCEGEKHWVSSVMNVHGVTSAEPVQDPSHPRLVSGRVNRDPGTWRARHHVDRNSSVLRLLI